MNRTDKPIRGVLLKAPLAVHHRYFDLIQGIELKPRPEAGCALLEGMLPGRCLGCFASTLDQHLSRDFDRWLSRQARIHSHFTLSTLRPVRQTRLLAVPSNPARQHRA